MWIGTAGGLSEFTPGAEQGQLFRNYTSANGLSQIPVHRLAEDGDGNLWIGTRSGGVMRLERPGFVSYREADGFLPGSLHHGIVETTRGELCVLTSTGPYRTDTPRRQQQF